LGGRRPRIRFHHVVEAQPELPMVRKESRSSFAYAVENAFSDMVAHNHPKCRIQEATSLVLTHAFHPKARLSRMLRTLGYPAPATDLQQVSFSLHGSLAPSVARKVRGSATFTREEHIEICSSPNGATTHSLSGATSFTRSRCSCAQVWSQSFFASFELLLQNRILSECNCKISGRTN
jgi:hypothetical protein